MSHANQSTGSDPSRFRAMMLAAVGVVYGDIGTSPLYTLREVFGGHHPLPVTPENVLGVLSLAIWALILVVTIKYVLFISRADNHGEGGTLALCTLALSPGNLSPRGKKILISLTMFGAALFYGDGMITPAISVLSAVEGLEVAAPSLHTWVIPLTVAILVGLFMVQRKGSAKVGALFGPVMVFWFLILAILGIVNMLQNPSVLVAINPMYAINYFVNHGVPSFLILASIVLAVTGGEAIYADMGHFGRPPIIAAWFRLIFPALVLNYMGQGALILKDPAAVSDPFFLLVPHFLLYPLIALATFATIIASQAVISGAFSMTRQAIQVGFAPRMHMVHTSEDEIGQIYIPALNWFLLAAVLTLVLGFRSSSALASAYGIAVTLEMAITSILAYFVMTGVWKWSKKRSGLIMVALLVVDLAFVAACATKIPTGGWFPIVMATMIFTLLATWHRGRELLAERVHSDTIPLDLFIGSVLGDHPPVRVEGTAIFMTSFLDGVPRALLHNMLHNHVLHERVVLLNVAVTTTPHVLPGERIKLEKLDGGFYRASLRFGYKDDPNVPAALHACGAYGLPIEMMETSFFLGRDSLAVRKPTKMGKWRQKLFMVMYRNAGNAADYFGIPPNRVVELGTQIEL